MRGFSANEHMRASLYHAITCNPSCSDMRMYKKSDEPCNIVLSMCYATKAWQIQLHIGNLKVVAHLHLGLTRGSVRSLIV